MALHLGDFTGEQEALVIAALTLSLGMHGDAYDQCGACVGASIYFAGEQLGEPIGHAGAFLVFERTDPLVHRKAITQRDDHIGEGEGELFAAGAE